jgi:polyribonucleotide nucleotidyltransferase
VASATRAPAERRGADKGCDMAVEVVTAEIGDAPISFETGKLAKQANGAVVVRSGDTVVLVTAVGAQEARPGADFFPLTVDVEERMYAAGKIPGGFIKRESRPSDRATLTARMTDRPIRPLWPKGYRNETQVVATILSVDQVNAFDILCLNGASAALMISELPFSGPVGAVRIGLAGDEFIINPTLQELEGSELDLIVAGTAEAISMVEAGAKEVDEETMLEALQIAHEEIRRLCDAQLELAKKAGKPKWEVTTAPLDEKLLAKVEKAFGKELEEATREPAKLARRDKVAAVRSAAAEKILGAEPTPEEAAAFSTAFDALEKRIIRQRIAVDKERPDGRAADEIRPITAEAGVLPRVHGSGLFTRGETQVLTSLALGTTKEAQRIDGLGPETTKRYIHHYNFPPFSVGETGFMRGPKRRDIGHGALAERALLPMIPDDVDFPYTLRLVSETLESNGSSSMASVCGSTLALLDAGVKITRSVAGIAMGLVKEGDDYIVLSDIQGDEDHLGDMDFKVAGTSEGITALQMDIKINGVTFDILRDALAQAKAGRQHILGIMAETLDGPRKELSAWAPRITAIKIDPERIGSVIGKGGETIRGLEADYEVEISIEDDGTVKVYGVDGAKADAAVEQIRAMTKDVEVGDTYMGAKVVKTTTFGAFVELTKGVDGLLHISNLGRGRVDKVEDVVNRGDTVDVTVVEVDRARGRIGLRIVGMEDVDGGGGDSGNGASVDGEGDGDGPPRRRRRRLTAAE